MRRWKNIGKGAMPALVSSHNVSKKHFSGAFWTIGLGLLFILSFTLPLVFAFHVSSGPEASKPSDAVAVQDFSPFQDELMISGPGANIKVQHSPVLEPEEGKDFVFFIWFRPKSIPILDEQVVFVSKFDSQTKGKAGYAFGVARDSESVFPIVYWRDQSGEGKLFRFAEMNFVSKVWNLMAVSFQKDKYLAVHAANLSGPGQSSKVRLLGGYQSEVRPASNADLVIGALKTGNYKGRIGPMGVLSAEGLGKNLESILESMLMDPNRIPSSIKDEAVKFWTLDGEEDLSPLHHELQAKGGVLKSGNQKKASSAKGRGGKKRVKKDAAG